MAKKLDNFAFAGGTKTDHDWNRYLNGDVWQLTEGEDFTCKLNTIGSLARLNAKKRGQRVKVSIDRESKTVTLQAIGKPKSVEVAPKPDPEKTAKPARARKRVKPAAE